MATTIERVHALCEELGWKPERRKSGDGDEVVVVFDTEEYRHERAARNALVVAVRLDGKGEHLVAVAPGLYTCKDGPHKCAVLQLLMMIGYRTRSVQWQYDFRDGEIRAAAGIPLEDAEPTARQLESLVRSLPKVVDAHHLAVRRALDRGIADLGQRVPAVPLGGVFEMLKALPEQRRKDALEAIRRRRRERDAPRRL